MNRALPLLLAAALAATGCRAQAGKGKASPGQAEKKAAKTGRPAVDFTHSVHVDQGIGCGDCHEGIEKATTLSKRHLPPDAKCAECHNDNRPSASLEGIPPPRLTFAHAQHLGQAAIKGKCDTCHKKLPEMGEPRVAPRMEACTACHKHQQDFAQGRCRPCHLDLKGYKPENAYAHSGDWLRQHPTQARPSAESCAACHDQTYCAQCHSATTTAARPSIIWPEEVQQSYIHRGDYVSRHTVDAGANPSSCRKCHGTKFCEACHVQQNLAKPNDVGRRPASHTGPDWSTNQNSGNFHGDAARRDVTSCANCHDQGASSTCVLCHHVGGIGGNPHPRSFLSKHDADDRQHNAMCRACHPN
jgi:Cytochrome c7 and related cytochrome c